MDSIQKLRSSIKELNQKIQDLAQNEFKEVWKEFFQAFPQVRAVGWTQYAPSWNDGDACTFSIHGIYYTTQTINLDSKSLQRGHFEDYDDEDEETARTTQVEWKYVGYGIEKLEQTLQEIEELDDSLFQNAFGESTVVIVTPTTIHTFEYNEHD